MPPQHAGEEEEDGDEYPHHRHAWSCPFTGVSLALGVVYLVVLVLVVRYFLSLFSRDKRSAQKCFLSLVMCTVTLRVVYFFSWPWEGRTCHPKPVTHDFHWTDAVGTFPACFFLSAFSVLTYTFSRIYHTVLRRSPVHSTMHTMYVMLIGLMMLASFGINTWALVESTDSASQLLAWYTVGTTLLVAVAFCLYGQLLYLDVEKVLHEAQQQNPELPPQPNSMRRIAVVSALCMACFLVRVTLLPLSMAEFGFTWMVGLAYFSLSEVVPLLLMLSVFDSRATSGEQTRQQYRPHEPLLSHPHSHT